MPNGFFGENSQKRSKAERRRSPSNFTLQSFTKYLRLTLVVMRTTGKVFMRTAGKVFMRTTGAHYGKSFHTHYGKSLIFIFQELFSSI